MNETYYADLLGFLAPQGQPPIAVNDLPSHVDLLGVTTAPPFFTSYEQIMNGGTSPDGERQLPGISGFRDLISSQDQLYVVETSSDIDTATKLGKTAIVLGLQQAPVDVDKKGLESLYSSGVRIMALEYQAGDSAYGSGWFDPDGQLKNKGRTLLENVANTGIILDLSHSAERTASDALDFIESESLDLPIVASHGGMYELYDGDLRDFDNRRNFKKETLQRVVELGGIVGMFALTFSLSSANNSETPFLNQIEAANKLFPGSVVIGSDAAYVKRDLKEWESTFGFMTRNISKDSSMRPRYPDTPLELNTPSKLKIIEQNLASKGMSDNDVQNVIGLSLKRYLTNNL